MKKIISNKEAVKKYNLKDYDPFGSMEFSNVLLFEGNLHVKGDLNYAWLANQMKELGENLNGNLLLIIDGNLKVDGILSPAQDFITFLFIKGNVECDVLLNYDEMIFINGDAHIKYALLGDYNDGCIEITGTTYVPYVLNSGHSTNINLTANTIKINFYNDSDDFIKYDFTVIDFDRVLVSGLVNKDGYLNTHKFIKMVREGKNPIKKGAKTNWQILQKQMDKLFIKKAPEKVTELDFRDKKLKSFPNQILDFPNLKVLMLSGNIIREIPGNIGKLQNLEELYLDHCGLRELPEEIGQLKNLRILDLSSNVWFDPENDYKSKAIILPEEIGNLINIEVLKINNNKDLSLPKSFGNLKNLKVFEASHCSDSDPIDFPEVITKLTGLKKLDIASNSFRLIPDAFCNLQNLEELNLNSSLCYLQNLPDLSSLKNLKILKANGLTGFTDRPHPKQSLLKSFFGITSLETLLIDRHGERNETYTESEFNAILKNLEFDPERAEDLKQKVPFKEMNPHHGKIFKGLARERLKPELLNGIGNLVNLRELDLGFNDLDYLPEEIYSLKKLEYINLEYNEDLSLNDLKRLHNTFPNAKIISKKIKTRVDINDANFIKVHNLVKNGAQDMHGEKFKTAVESFKAALKLCAPDKKFHEYDVLYAHYGIVYSLSRLILNIKDLNKRKKIAKEIWSYGEIALTELVPADGLIWAFTEEGAFQQECIRYIGNALGWLAYEDLIDSEKMEKAVSFSSRATQYADSSHEFILDTYARLLLKAGRREEAYAIVHKVLYRDPDFEDFKDFKKNKDYKNWVSSYK